MTKSLKRTITCYQTAGKKNVLRMVSDWKCCNLIVFLKAPKCKIKISVLLGVN